MKKIKKAKLLADLDNVEAIVFALHLKDALNKYNISICKSEESSSFSIVCGGDGTMLHFAHKYGLNPIFFGVNCGHKGFLMNDGSVEMIARSIAELNFVIRHFPVLEIEAENGWKSWAINDIYFNRIGGHTVKIKVKINGTEIGERISGDGIVVCTALGSTGYFVPVGGSVIHPMAPVIGLAPVVPNTPIQLVPVIFPIDTTVEIILLSPSIEVRGWYDGLDLPKFKKIRIRSSRKFLKLAFLNKENFVERLVRKILGKGGST